jgi:AAA-like domain
MARSLRIHPDRIEGAKLSLKRNGFPNQKILAEEVGLAISTVNNFLNGKPVDYHSFKSVCDCLALDWQKIADWGEEELTPLSHSSLSPAEIFGSSMPVGGVNIDSPFYIERSAIDSRCYEAVLQPSSLIRIKSPHQMGKTSLMDRILHRSLAQGARTVKVNFQGADRSIFDDLDALLQWFCNKVSWKLQLSQKASTWWSDTFGSKDNCTSYFEEFILPAADSPLVLGLDDVDCLFQHPLVAADFFGLLRAWYEESGMGEWGKLRIVIAHSTEVYIPLGSDESPFNVGLPIELPEFTILQVQELVKKYGLAWDKSMVNRLMDMVGGHPYLIRLALYHIAQQDMNLSELLSIAPTDAEPYGEHLRRLWNNIKNESDLLHALQKVMGTEAAVEIEPDLSFQLYSMGVVIRKGNQISPRCQLYRRFFISRSNSPS